MALAFGDFSLDLESRQLLRAGREVRLSPKALQLLELLVAERPRALAKTEIRDRLWPCTFVSESSLTGLVTTLRSVLRDSARDPRYLRTVHGLGYAFCGVVTDDAPRRKSAARRGLHFRLTWEGGDVPLVEGENVLGRGSKNGTFLNGRKITSAVALADADEIRLGLMPLTLRVVGGGTSTKTAKA